ncbi:MAG: NAD-dependent epimerase/dehydratase family protein [Candidatus Nanopelagicales bacterium]|nr:NAD-dependent epimerase/dehydratase family protein [Candidatus Nanopelagicales bacterium]
MRILVTGGAGFIGSNLVRRFLSDGDSVAVIDDLSTGFADNLTGLDIDFFVASILDENALAGAAAGAEAIVHLAALGSVPRSVENPVASHSANATGTLMVLEAARRERAYVTAASSSSVYGSVPDLPRVESLPTRPMSPYAASKLATESYVLAYGTSYDLPTLPFRFFNVYGQRQAAGHVYAAVIPTFIDAALRGVPLPLNGDGLQSRDFTFVDTVTWVLADAVHRRVRSSVPVNLAIGANVTLLDLIAELEQLLCRELPVEHRSDRVGDVRASQSNPVLLRELFPDVPEIPFRTGLTATVDWFQNPQSSSQATVD